MTIQEVNKQSLKIMGVLDKWAEKPRGLTLLTNPAGSGKSYETAFYIDYKIVAMEKSY